MTDPNNGLMTKVWGPPAWVFLHAVTFGYPINPSEFDTKNNQNIGTTKLHYKNFLTNTGNIFPCKYCRESYKSFLIDLPLTDLVLSNRDNLVKWFWEIHNKVNTKLGSKGTSLTKVKKKYESYRASCTKGKQLGCTVPIQGKKLRSIVLTFPDICPITIVMGIGLMLIISGIIYKTMEKR